MFFYTYGNQFIYLKICYHIIIIIMYIYLFYGDFYWW